MSILTRFKEASFGPGSTEVGRKRMVRSKNDWWWTRSYCKIESGRYERALKMMDLMVLSRVSLEDQGAATHDSSELSRDREVAGW